MAYVFQVGLEVVHKFNHLNQKQIENTQSKAAGISGTGMEKEFENEFGKAYCKVNYISGFNTLVVTWRGYSTKLQVETVMAWLEESMKHVPCETMINDCSDILSVWSDSIDWLSRIWAQKMTNMGLKQILHVARANGFGYKIGVEMEKSLIKQVDFRYFGTKAEAVQHLENIRKISSVLGTSDHTNGTRR